MKTTLKYYRPYILPIVLIIAFLFGQAMCELALPGYMSDIINNGIVKQDMGYIRHTGLIMIAVAAATVVCAIMGSLLASRTAARSSRDIRRALFRKVTAFSAAELNDFSTASLITRSTNDVQMVQQATVMILRLACFAPIMGIGAVIKALNTSVSLSWTIGIALLVILGIMMVSFFLVLPKFQVLQTKLDKLNLLMKERLSGVLVIRAFNTEKSEEKRFDIANRDLTKINMFTNKAMSFMMPMLMFVMNGVSILIVWAGAHLVNDGSLMIGDMLAYLQYAMHVIMSFLFITMMFIMIPRAIVSAKRIGEVLDVEPSIEDPEMPETVEDHRGVVEFDHVSFSYPDAEKEVLEDISFTAGPGRTTAIIGGTGSGKSTLISLIPRFYDATEGSVRVDGKDVRDITQHELRDQIGYVPQKGLLFSGTIASNLQYGKEDATEAEMLEAAETAQAMDFIREKEHGLDEEVAQGGTNVSGGQKQRLSIARALVKKPKIYIFDDSFSALDFKTDKALREALKEKVGDSTIIIVAQRINTIIDADQILVLDEGRLAGKGTHDELMQTCDVYREIALSQLSEEELERGRK
ncbi:Putative multidrug export ATP-binding/permease protein SAV1866 [uncultured Eubacterium sp.]|uniref:ABC transporter ATP-binding protein n=1 Tax=Brotomerdimonas butyrica TaxID=2981721 RepID=UPI00082114C9|nr:ABC transporter ATP-binding protein [Brotomerdimonas butyrica]MCU6755585.1 ABC transporter ATP-binding protein/permease [Brotomerdimonas butyrica]SCH38748.1 Putative multidrug export ATP-binding/permease protein SAV1866 [uncultured Eubacterium sp.]